MQMEGFELSKVPGKGETQKLPINPVKNINHIIKQIKSIKKHQVMLKILAVLVLCLSLTMCEECFGEECAHRSVVPTTDPADPVEVARLIEDELRRQYWYYLRDSVLLYEKSFEIPGRRMFYYFHRNIVGTFFTICSWNIEGKFSEVNTLVRLGAGKQDGIKYNVKPASLYPFVLQSEYPGDQEDESVVMADEGDTVVSGFHFHINVIDTEEARICYERSNTFLRDNYWFYLRNADETSRHTLSTRAGDYISITFKNIVGEFMVLTSCHDDGELQVNTFVRFGGTRNEPNQVLIVDIDKKEAPEGSN